MSSILNILKTDAPDDCSNGRLVRDSAIEFLATTIFIYFGTMSAVATSSMAVGTDVSIVMPISFAFGVSILALAHSIGHLTGGHMNPGVTFLMFLRRQISAVKMASYIICQLVAALLASSLVWGSSSGLTNDGDGKPPFMLGSTTLNPQLTTGNGFLLELMGSFFFYFVIAQTALDKRGIAATPFPALPIGLILVVVHICLVPFTGCGVNPARSFGPAMVTCMGGSSEVCKDAAGSWYWIYYVAPFLAAFLVAEVTMLINCEEGDDEEVAEKVLDDEEVAKDA